eukprot:jgi/Ulvmu1/12388/UM009_0034.1
MPVHRRPFSSLLLPSRAGRGKVQSPGKTPPPRPGASLRLESNTDESLSDIEAASNSQFPNSHATSAERTAGRHCSVPTQPTAPQPPRQASSLRTASTESVSREVVEGTAQVVSSRRNAADFGAHMPSCVKGVRQSDEDGKGSGGDATRQDNLTSVKDDSAVATNTTATSNSKLRSGATSRPRPKHEHPSQPLPRIPRPPKYLLPTLKRDPDRRAQQPPRKRVKVCIKLGDITSSRPGTPRTPASTLPATDAFAGLLWPQQAPPPARLTPGSNHYEPHIATTLSLTSLIHGSAPLTTGGPWSDAASSHGEYCAPTRQPPSGAPRLAARTTAAPRRATPSAALPFQPPVDAEEVPETVRRDRAVINTMQVCRRTSSRWSEYARDGAPWVPEEDAWLLRQHRAGCPAAWLSEQLSRTKSAVKARLKRQQDRGA